MNRRGFLKLLGLSTLSLPPLLLAKNLPDKLPPNPEAARLEFEQTGKVESQVSHTGNTGIWSSCYATSMVWMSEKGRERGGDL